MKKTALSFVLAVMSLPLAAEDFKAGLDAYNRGDFTTALQEWQPIAERGDPNAQYNVGLLYARGQGVPQDYTRATEWYRKAAGQDVAAAQYNLGLIYAMGQGVPKNYEEAAKWFLKAANHGIASAASNLGVIYSDDSGGVQNYAEAQKWYRKAAEHGIASAAFNLGVMYDTGEGVPQNYSEALKWYHKAADAGYASAFTNIGILYYNAQGVKRDLVQAYTWFGRANKLGDQRAGELLDMTAAKLKPKQVKTAKADVEAWQPTPAQTQTEPATDDLFAPLPQNAPFQQEAPASPGTADRATPPAEHPVPPADTGAPLAAAGIQDVWDGADRIVAVGDIHGDYEQFVMVLQSASLIDGNGDWRGGKTHLVQTGDIVDRGPDSRAILDLLMRLEQQAVAAGGGVHCLIGNHEAMDAYGDLRYVSPGEFAAFAPQRSDAKREATVSFHDALITSAKPDLDRSQWTPEHPAGFDERRDAFGPNGVYGQWIRRHNAAIKIGRTLFIHAGLGPKYQDWSLDRINQAVRRELDDFASLNGGVAADEQGPLWFDGLAKGDEGQLEPLVNLLLQHFDVDRIVVGHTYANGAVTPRFGGKVILIDVGIPRIYDNSGKVACLELDKDQPFALHRGQRLDLPKDETGPDMLRYLRQAAGLDPQPSPLMPQIEKLEKK